MSTVLENSDTVAEAIRPTLDKFAAAAAPYLKNAAEQLYENLLYSVQDYLRDNAEWNIGEEIARCRRIELYNVQLHQSNADLLAAAQLALSVAESWIHDQLDGTGSIEGELAELDPVRAVIARATGAA